MKISFFLVAIFFVIHSHALDVNCSEPHLLDKSHSNSVELRFYNGGSVWTGYHKTYLEIHYSKDGQFERFVYNPSQVSLMEISTSIYKVQAKVYKTYSEKPVLVTCHMKI